MNVRHRHALVNSDTGDQELLARVREKDRLAFRSLYDGYHQQLFRFLFSITHRRDFAEEGVNDVMMVVWEKAGSFQGRSTVSTWLMGIAYRIGLKQIDRSRRRNQREQEACLEQASEPFGAAEQLTDELELHDWLATGLQALSFEQRTVVELTYFWGHSYKEIAEILDCPVNTVKTRMFHARAKLKTSLSSMRSDGNASSVR